MTDSILKLMDIRRTYKGKDKVVHSKIQREIRREIRSAKENFMKDKCAEIEEYQKKHDLFNVHKKIKEATENIRRKKHSLPKDTNGNYVIELNDKLKIWKEYIEKLFKDSRDTHAYRNGKSNLLKNETPLLLRGSFPGYKN